MFYLCFKKIQFLGVDKWGSIAMDFGEGRHACLYYGGFCWSATSAFISFENGQIQVYFLKFLKVSVVRSIFMYLFLIDVFKNVFLRKCLGHYKFCFC